MKSKKKILIIELIAIILGVLTILFLISLIPIHDCGYQLPYYHCDAWGWYVW